MKYLLEFPALYSAYVTSLRLEFQLYDEYFSTTISNAFILGGNKEDIMVLDRDNDGIPDGLDTDKDNDGIGDNDGDGVPDQTNAYFGIYRSQ